MMYVCKYCMAEFNSKGELLAHYRQGCRFVPSGRNQEEVSAGIKVVIPYAFLPPEARALSSRQLVVLKVIGRPTETGIVVQDVAMT